MTTINLLWRLQGAHKPEEPGARGIERVARNPDCLLLRALTITGFTPATAARILGIRSKEGQSPFAIQMGQRFDKVIKPPLPKRMGNVPLCFGDRDPALLSEPANWRPCSVLQPRNCRSA